jgi:hypothetical protein
MKHIITLILAIAAAGCLTLSAQEIATQPTASQALLSPENVGYAYLTPRSQLASYPTRDQMMAGGTSGNIIPLQEWQSEEVEAGTKYTTRFKRNYRLDDKEIILCIENATGAVSVEVNGNEIGYSVTGSPRAEFDLTKKLKEWIHERPKSTWRGIILSIFPIVWWLVIFLVLGWFSNFLVTFGQYWDKVIIFIVIGRGFYVASESVYNLDTEKKEDNV